MIPEHLHQRGLNEHILYLQITSSLLRGLNERVHQGRHILPIIHVVNSDHQRAAMEELDVFGVVSEGHVFEVLDHLLTKSFLFWVEQADSEHLAPLNHLVCPREHVGREVAAVNIDEATPGLDHPPLPATQLLDLSLGGMLSRQSVWIEMGIVPRVGEFDRRVSIEDFADFLLDVKDMGHDSFHRVGWMEFI